MRLIKKLTLVKNKNVIAFTALSLLSIVGIFACTMLISKASINGVLGVDTSRKDFDRQITVDAYYVSPDGKLAKSKEACSINKGQNFDRAVHFKSIQDGLSCIGSGDTLIVNAQDSFGVIRAYDESGLGYNNAIISSGTAGKNTQIIGRCNQDIVPRILIFSRSSCKTLLQPSAQTWGMSLAEKRSSVWEIGGSSYIKISNFEISAQNIGTAPDGTWDGSLCHCWAGSAFTIFGSAHHITIDAVKVHHMPGTGLVTRPTDSIKSTSLTLIGSEFYHNGWNYPASEQYRFGDGSATDEDKAKYLVQGKPAYWTHLHSVELHTNDNSLLHNYFYDDVGSSLQIGTNDSSRNEVLKNNIVSKNYFASSGWKAKLEPNGGGNEQGGLQIFSGNALKFYNNIIFNNAGVTFENITESRIYNNSFVYNESGVGAVTSLSIRNSSSSNQFYNNLLCNNRDGNALSDTLTLVNRSGKQPITSNGSIGDKEHEYLYVNANNIFGQCSKTQQFSGWKDAGSPIASKGSVLPDPNDFRPKSDIRIKNAGSDLGAPATDFFGNTRIDSPDIGAIEIDSITRPVAPSSNNVPNVEKIVPSSVATLPRPQACTRFEAEEGSLSEGSTTANTIKNDYSGYGYVDNWGFKDSSVEFKGFNLPDSGIYAIKVRYIAGYGVSRKEVYVDGIRQNTLELVATPDWSEWQFVEQKMHIKKGEHSISIVSAGGKYALFDYIDICLDLADFAPSYGTKVISLADSVVSSIPASQPVGVSGSIVSGAIYINANEDQLLPVKQVKYTSSGRVLSIDSSSPYTLNSELLANGIHTITETIEFNDGSTNESTASINVQNKQFFYSDILRFYRFYNKQLLSGFVFVIICICIVYYLIRKHNLHRAKKTKSSTNKRSVGVKKRKKVTHYEES